MRIEGWSPYGSPKNTRLSETEALDLQKKIDGYFSPDQNCAWRWDRPWLSNFQLVIHVDGAQEQGDVFRAKSEIQAILDPRSLNIKGAALEVRVEADKERSGLQLVSTTLKHFSEHHASAQQRVASFI